MAEINYMTKEGFEALDREIKLLKAVTRPGLSNAIAEAREKGDLSENAEYHAAREELAHLEAKISQLETQLANAKIVDETKLDLSKVSVLSKVEVFNKKLSKKQVFTVVSEAEADLKSGKISSTSPIGKALLGKKVGEIALAQTPAGVMELEVLSISI